LIKWRKYIVDNYIKNIKLCCLGQTYDLNYIKAFGFNQDELSIVNSKLDLAEILETESLLLKLFAQGNIELVFHLLYSNFLEFNVNEIQDEKTLFTYYLDYYLIQDNEDLKRNYLDFENRILLLYMRGYKAKAEDKASVKSKNFKSDPRRLKYLLFVSYSLKLDDLNSIHVLIRHMNLITCLACLKNDMNIGFYKSIEIQINKIIHRSDYQTEIINYIRSNKKIQYKALEDKLLESRLSVSDKVIDRDLREVVEILI
jgi:hypothetical protein